MTEPNSTSQVDLRGNKGITTIRIWRRGNHTLRQEVTENGARLWFTETKPTKVPTPNITKLVDMEELDLDPISDPGISPKYGVQLMVAVAPGDVEVVARRMTEAAPIAAEFTTIAAEWHNK